MCSARRQPSSLDLFWAPTQRRVFFEGLGSFTWGFIPAETEFHILGADFLFHFGLVVDVGRLALYRRRTAMAASNLCLAMTLDPLVEEEVPPIPLAP